MLSDFDITMVFFFSRNSNFNFVILFPCFGSFQCFSICFGCFVFLINVGGFLKFNLLSGQKNARNCIIGITFVRLARLAQEG